MWSSWSILTTTWCISKELWYPARAQSHSFWMLSCPHMIWWLLPILFCWASVQRLPLLSLQEAHTLFWYFFCTVLGHMMQSLEAVSISELASSSIDKSESDEAWSLVFLDLPATAALSGSAVAVIGLEEGLVGSCPCCQIKPGPTYSTNLGMFLLHCAELCSLLASISWELTWVILLQWSASEPLEEWSHFFFMGMARNSANMCLTWGVPAKGISTKGNTGNGGVLGGWDGLLERPWAMSHQAQMHLWYLGSPHPVAWQRPALCSCSKGELQRTCTKAVTW